jgi:hypothetical protein
MVRNSTNAHKLLTKAPSKDVKGGSVRTKAEVTSSAKVASVRHSKLHIHTVSVEWTAARLTIISL